MDKEAQHDWYDMCQRLRNGQIDADYLLKWLKEELGYRKLPEGESPLLSEQEIDNLTPTKEEIDNYLAKPDDEVAASLDPYIKRMAARIILYTNKVAQAQREADIKWYGG